MAHKHIPLAATKFSDLHVQLPSAGPAHEAVDSVSEISNSLDSQPASVFPSLRAGKKEHFVSTTVRIKISQMDALKKLRLKHDIDVSVFVREFIDLGLEMIKKNGFQSE